MFMTKLSQPSYASVPMPEKNVSHKVIKGNEYVYHIGQGYRNSKDQPTSHQTTIGKYEKETGMLIPNDNYFRIYGRKPQPRATALESIKNYGSYYLLKTIAREHQLETLLYRIFGDEAESILMLAIYMTLEGNVLSNCEDWMEETLTGSDFLLSSQECSRILNVIDEARRNEFFRTWVHIRQQEEYLAYDVTSISSYSKLNEDVEFGYNRDKEKLPQINLGMYYGETSKLPVYYRTYYGSIPDKAHLIAMMEGSEKIGVKNARFVMDRGFFSKGNLIYLNNHTSGFIVGMPNGLLLSQEIILAYGEKIKSARYDLGTDEVSGMAIERNDYGFRCNIHLMYSDEKMADEKHHFKAELRKWQASIIKGLIPKEAEPFFRITKDKNDVVRSVEADYEAIDAYMKGIGYFLVLSTDFRKNTAEILEIYRMKDVIEKSFDNIKNHLDMKRLRIHSAQAEEGKMFLAFLALILRTHVFNTTKDYIRKKRLSLDRIFFELRKIKVAVYPSGVMMHNPLTKKQKDILAYFNKKEDDISESLKHILKPGNFLK